jgi:transposase-like protein
MAESDPKPLGGIVEIDETYVGGRIRGMGVKYAKKQKKVVMGAVERGGKLRLRHVPDAKHATISGFVKATLSPDVERVMTDQHGAYPTAMAPEFTGRHERVNHIIGEYVRGDVTTNSIESAFSLLKRGVIGQFHKLSGKHLHRYLAEFEYRFNHRTDADVFIGTVQRLCGFKPLRFAALTSDQKS